MEVQLVLSIDKLNLIQMDHHVKHQILMVRQMKGFIFNTQQMEAHLGLHLSIYFHIHYYPIQEQLIHITMAVENM